MVEKRSHNSRIAAVATGFQCLPALFKFRSFHWLWNLAVKWLYRAGSCTCTYPAETLMYCNLNSSKRFVCVCVCVRMCVHDLCLSAQAFVGVQMQAWKENGIFFVLKSWYSEVSVGILEYCTKKTANDNKIPDWQQSSQDFLKIGVVASYLRCA